MIKQLRKRHLQVWTLLLLLLPAGIIAAWISIPEQPAEDFTQPVRSGALPVLLRTVEKTNYSIHLRTDNKRSALQLEWINKSALTSPSALIYQLNDPPAKEITDNGLIGRIDVKGKFYFNLRKDQPVKTFVLYDIIHHKSVDTIKIQP